MGFETCSDFGDAFFPIFSLHCTAFRRWAENIDSVILCLRVHSCEEYRVRERSFLNINANPLSRIVLHAVSGYSDHVALSLSTLLLLLFGPVDKEKKIDKRTTTNNQTMQASHFIFYAKFPCAQHMYTHSSFNISQCWQNGDNFLAYLYRVLYSFHHLLGLLGLLTPKNSWRQCAENRPSLRPWSLRTVDRCLRKSD